MIINYFIFVLKLFCMFKIVLKQNNYLKKKTFKIITRPRVLHLKVNKKIQQKIIVNRWLILGFWFVRVRGPGKKRVHFSETNLCEYSTDNDNKYDDKFITSNNSNFLTVDNRSTDNERSCANNNYTTGFDNTKNNDDRITSHTRQETRRRKAFTSFDDIQSRAFNYKRRAIESIY